MYFGSRLTESITLVTDVRKQVFRALLTLQSSGKAANQKVRRRVFTIFTSFYTPQVTISSQRIHSLTRIVW